MNGCEIIVIGSGALARAVCYAIASSFTRPATVSIIARSISKARDTAYVANAHAVLHHVPVAFRTVALDPASIQALIAAFARIKPFAVLHCASYQSPWERLTAPSDWTALVERIGFGCTLPLQATLPIQTARALANASPDTLLLNGCFPDGVNPVLKALGLPVFCGIGNVAVIATTLQWALGLDSQRSLQVLAHHAHFHAPERPEEELLAWYDGSSLTTVTEMLKPQRAASRAELSLIAAQSSALLLRDLVTEEESFMSLPGPHGLPGGYPVRIRARSMELNLPNGMESHAAIAWNATAGLRDGVRVSDGRVTFSVKAERELKRYLPRLANGFAVEEIDRACNEFLKLRGRMRLSNMA